MSHVLVISGQRGKTRMVAFQNADKAKRAFECVVVQMSRRFRCRMAQKNTALWMYPTGELGTAQMYETVPARDIPEDVDWTKWVDGEQSEPPPPPSEPPQPLPELPPDPEPIPPNRVSARVLLADEAPGPHPDHNSADPTIAFAPDTLRALGVDLRPDVDQK